MQEITEQLAAQGKIAQILDMRSAMRIVMRIGQFLLCDIGKALPDQRNQLAIPGLVDNRLMRQNREGVTRSGKNEQHPGGHH